jgi:hypothetical protein
VRSRRIALAGVLSLLLIITPSFISAVKDSNLIGGTDSWTFVGTPVVERLGIFRAAETTLSNHLPHSVLGVVIMVLRNSQGQTVYYSTATLNITRGLYWTAYTVEYGLAPGVYNATIFAISTTGVAISNSSTVTFVAR